MRRFCGRLCRSVDKAGEGGSSFRKGDAFLEDDIGQVRMANEIDRKPDSQMLGRIFDTEGVHIQKKREAETVVGPGLR